jgi:co-chaperonin GroES (HSP10)
MSVKCLVSAKVLKENGVKKLPYLPAFDRCLVKQIPEDERETFGDTGIIKPKAMKSGEDRAACRGVLLAAGLGALDHLAAHGIEVGDTVWFSKLSPWRHVVDNVGGHDLELMFLRSADLAGSEEAMARVLSGELTVELDEQGQHVFARDGKQIARSEPAVDEY